MPTRRERGEINPRGAGKKPSFPIPPDGPPLWLDHLLCEANRVATVWRPISRGMCEFTLGFPVSCGESSRVCAGGNHDWVFEQKVGIKDLLINHKSGSVFGFWCVWVLWWQPLASHPWDGPSVVLSPSGLLPASSGDPWVRGSLALHPPKSPKRAVFG